MPIFNLFNKTAVTVEKEKEKKKAAVPLSQTTFVQQPEKAGLLVTEELDKALNDCRAKVDRISKDCKMRNRKFRDVEFDIELDKERCLHGLGETDESYDPSDVQRVSEIFENPQFFVDGADSADLVQGGSIGDCWFVSALATMATKKNLVERFCVARDEQVGVYGFIFFRDAYWVTVIIDDLLYTSIPKFEELAPQEKQLYHNNKEFYNKYARQGTKSLYFAKSATQGETWVPLIEKAYAKLHGSYAALGGGQACEAIEDLTGGISTFIPARDIFDIDRFWNEELRKANVDRLFGCAYQSLSGARSGDYWHSPEIFGLMGNHAYSVLRAVEVNGKRFVIVRNPWGNSEWTGPWSDGSKEWTKEWLERLPEFGHVFGDDGQFVMEYKDFLSCWDRFDRTLLLDDSWAMSSQWLHVTTRPLPSAWTFGDVSFTFSLSEPTLAIIVLSQIDDRYFKEISGCSYWQFDFIIFKAGEKEILAESSLSRLCSRSVNVEVNLDAGDYVIHVRLDRHGIYKTVYQDPDQCDTNPPNRDQRSLSRMKSERAIGQSIASNFKKESERFNLPVSLDVLAGQNLSQLESKALALAKAKQKEEEEAKKKDDAKAEESEKELLEAEQSAATEAGPAGSEPEKNSTTTVVNDDGSTTTITTSVVKKVVRVTTRNTEDGEEVESREEVTTIPNNVPVVAAITVPINGGATQESDAGSDGDDSDDEDDEADPSRDVNDVSEDNSIFLGLKVYTKREVSPVKIAGQLGHGMELSAELALP